MTIAISTINYNYQIIAKCFAVGYFRIGRVLDNNTIIRKKEINKKQFRSEVLRLVVNITIRD